LKIDNRNLAIEKFFGLWKISVNKKELTIPRQWSKQVNGAAILPYLLLFVWG